MTKRILLGLLGFYRAWISPAIQAVSPMGCKFQPTCSHYASEAIERHGAWHGGWLALWRLARCHPFTRGGYDPVPLAASDRGPETHGPPHKPLP